MPDFKPTMKDYKQLTPFKFQILQSFPFIAEDFDSLTNYELLCKVVEYLNDVINNEKNVEDNVTALYNSFVELQDYVDNYFDNLDVQDEINNKLEDMAEDGSLYTIISSYTQPIVNEQNIKINTIENKVNSLSSGSPLVASSIDGMTDTSRVYVNTTDGYWYYYNNQWTRGGVYQATEIPENSIGVLELSTEFKSETNNLLNVNQALQGYSYSTTQTNINSLVTQTNANFTAYPVIPVIPGAQYRPYNSSGDAKAANNTLFFDVNGDFVSQQGIGPDDDFTIPNNVYYLCFASRTDYNITQFKRTDIPNFSPTYEPYKYKSNIALKSEIQDSINYFKPTIEFTDNYYLNSSGEAVTDQYSEPYCITNYIKVYKDLQIYMHNIIIQRNVSITLYDVNKNVLSTITNPTNLSEYTLTTPENCYYIRCCVLKVNKNILDIHYINAKYQPFQSDKKQILKNINSKPLITWVDDDTNSLTAIRKVKAICDNLGIKATFGCVTYKLDSINGLKEELLNYQNEGFNIVSHTHTHNRWYKDDDGNTKFNYEECLNDLMLSLTTLNNYGFLDYDYVIAPGSAMSRTDIDTPELVSKWAKAYVNPSANAVYNDYYTPDQYHLNRTFINAQVHDLDYYKNMIDTAIANNYWIIFGTHSYSNTEFNETLVENVLSYALQNNVEILTLNQAYKKRHLNYEIKDLNI